MTHGSGWQPPKRSWNRGHGKPASVADVTLRHDVDPNAAHLEVLAVLVGATTIESGTPTDNE